MVEGANKMKIFTTLQTEFRLHGHAHWPITLYTGYLAIYKPGQQSPIVNKHYYHLTETQALKWRLMIRHLAAQRRHQPQAAR